MRQLLPLFCLFFLCACSEDHEKVDLLFYNGKIHTVDSTFNITEAMVLRDGKIIATGKTEDLKSKYRATEEIDLQEKFVYPGFIDAHCHFINQAISLRRVNLFGTTSFKEVIKRVIEFQNEHQLEFIAGRGWDQNDWEIKEFPDKAALDSAFPNTPVALTRVDGHAMLVNQAALDYAGITEESIVEGGIFVKNNEGKLSGILVDNALDFIDIPLLPAEEMLGAVHQTESICFSYGLTGLHDAGLNWREINYLDSLQQNDLLKMRMYVMISASEEDVFDSNPQMMISNPLLQVRSYKFYADGALGSRGACLLHPYHDAPGHYGLLLNSGEYFKKAAAFLAKEGFQMNTHAIGDSANRMMLNFYSQYTKKTDRRWRIEHAQVVNEKDFELFERYDVIPSVQPTHATSDMYWAKERLGPERVKDAYAYKRLLEQYGKIALGTDFPIEDISTIKTFYAATIRKDANNYPENGFQMENALSREEALRGMTIWAAYAAFEEKVKGSLEAGKYADFIIMDTDLINAPAEQLLNAQVLETYLNGQRVFIR